MKTKLNRLFKLRFVAINPYSCHLQPRMDSKPDSLATVLQNLAEKFPNYWNVSYRSLSPKASGNLVRKDQPPKYRNWNCFLNVPRVLEFFGQQKVLLQQLSFYGLMRKILDSPIFWQMMFYQCAKSRWKQWQMVIICFPQGFRLTGWLFFSPIYRFD